MSDVAGQWYRVSDDTLDWHNQVAKVTGYIATRGYETSDELRYIADDKSAFKREHIAELERALEDLRAGRITVLVIRNTDRIDRSKDLGAILARVKSFGNGARIESVEEPWVGEMTGLPAELLTVVTQYTNNEYSRGISRKVTDAHASIRARGAWVGKIPFGYVTEGETGRKALIPGADAELAREVFQRIADGRSASSVAAWLDDVCPQVITKTGKRSPWRAKRVIEMVRNPTYKGRHATHAGYEALVSVKVWDGANAAMATRSARSYETGGRTATNGYSGAVYCAECGQVALPSPVQRGTVSPWHG